jgi:hypothetical protein
MRLISYADLARLRLTEFLDREAEVDVEESGIQIVVGLGGYEAYGESRFGWKQNEEYQIAEITLDLGPDSILPTEAAKRILGRVGLPIDKGMPASALIQTLGSPERDERGRPGLRLLYFVCGEDDKYLVGCDVDDHDGLTGVYVARKDYCDEDDAL